MEKVVHTKSIWDITKISVSFLVRTNEKMTFSITQKEAQRCAKYIMVIWQIWGSSWSLSIPGCDKTKEAVHWHHLSGKNQEGQGVVDYYVCFCLCDLFIWHFWKVLYQVNILYYCSKGWLLWLYLQLWTWFTSSQRIMLLLLVHWSWRQLFKIIFSKEENLNIISDDTVKCVMGFNRNSVLTKMCSRSVHKENVSTTWQNHTFMIYTDRNLGMVNTTCLWPRWHLIDAKKPKRHRSDPYY